MTLVAGCFLEVIPSVLIFPAGAIFRECLPFVAICGLGLLVITFVPALSLGLWHAIAQ